MVKKGKKPRDTKKAKSKKGSKPAPKGGACFMKFNSAGNPYRVCKSGAELKFEKERAKKNKKKAKTIDEKRKALREVEVDILKAKRELKKVNKELKDKKSKKK